MWVCLTPQPTVKNFGCLSRVWFQISTLHLLVNEVPTFMSVIVNIKRDASDINHLV